MLVALSMPRRERASQIKAWLERCMIRKTIVIIIMAAFATNIGRCADLVKGKLYFFSDTGIVAQKVKGGVLLWGRDDLAKGKSWHDADILALLRLKNTYKFKKGMPGGGGWFKYVGMHRHGSILVGYRDVPMFEIPSKEEIEQAEYQQQEEEKRRLAKQVQQRQISEEQQRFEDEQRKIRDQAEQERVNRELQKQRAENERKLAAERARAEIEAEKQRQEAARQAEEERKRRYPIEQKQRAEYASVKLGGISFDWKSYVRMQKDLLRYVYSIEVTEKKWGELQNLQREKNWLGMLNAIAEATYSDFPDEKIIASVVNKLTTTQFHISIKFTHDNLRIETQEGFSGKYTTHYEDKVSKELIVAFRITNVDPIKNLCYIYNPFAKGYKLSTGYCDPWTFYGRKAKEQREKVKSSIELGMITLSERDNALKQIENEFNTNVIAWFDTAMIDGTERMHPIAGREKQISPVATKSSISGKVSRGNESTKPKWIACPDCNGSRYISKGKCPNCDGVGRYRTSITQGIGGRPMGGKIRQCDKCKASGEIKELCKRCHGRGKVKQ